MFTDNNEYKILVIEDNRGDYVLVEDFLLEKIAAPLLMNATSFGMAKGLLQRADANFDVVLLDLSLPDKTGKELIRDILEVCGSIPVIVLTGYVDFGFSVESLSQGIADYVLKEDLTALSLYKSVIYSMERKKTTTELQESEKKYSELFHLSPLPMWVFDVATLRFLDVNAAAVRNYGYEYEEFLAMTIKNIRPQEDMPQLEAVLGKRRVANEFATQGIFRHVRKDGTIIYVDIKSNPVDYKGSAAKVIIAYDLTEKLEHIKVIEQSNAKLKDIAWMQSHVVRAPVARIMGLVHLLKDLPLSGAEQEEILDYIMESATDLDGVIRNISEAAGGGA